MATSNVKLITAQNLGASLPVDPDGKVTAVSVSRQVNTPNQSVFLTTTNEVVPVEDWSQVAYFYVYGPGSATALITAQQLADALTFTPASGIFSIPANLDLVSMPGNEMELSPVSSQPTKMFDISLSNNGSSPVISFGDPLSDYPYMKPVLDFYNYKAASLGTKVMTMEQASLSIAVSAGGAGQIGQLIAACKPWQMTAVLTDNGITLSRGAIAFKTLGKVDFGNAAGLFADLNAPTGSEKLAVATGLLSLLTKCRSGDLLSLPSTPAAQSNLNQFSLSFTLASTPVTEGPVVISN